MNKKPHICPVCNGSQVVPNGFYMQTSGMWSGSDATPEMCRSCDGTGILWEPEHNTEYHTPKTINKKQ